MNVLKSLREFGRVLREDAAYRRLGRPFGWSLLFHYRGRWYDRMGTDMPLERVGFRIGGHALEFELNASSFGPFKGVFIEREYDCLSALARPPKRVLDLGGNVGFGSVFFSRAFPEASIAVVEPDPRNVRVLRRNLEANGVKATIVDGAIGPEEGAVKLRFGDDPACSSLVGTGMHDHPHSVEVAVTTVPRVMEKAGWDHVDLVKIDIEGTEEDLLARNNAWLGCVDAIILEIHPNTTPAKLNGYLAPYSFELARFGSGHEPVYFARKRTP
jgi:FkbM family methyltransferase